MRRPTIEAIRTIRPATPAATKCRAQAWARKTLPRVFTPSVRSHCSGVISRNGAGASVPAAPTRMSRRPCRATTSATSVVGALDLGEIGRMRDAAAPSRSTASSSSPPGRSTHATRAPGSDERLGAREADPALGARHERDLAVEAPRPRDGVRSRQRDRSASTSTGMSNGSAARRSTFAPRAAPRRRGRGQSEKPLITRRVLGEAVDRVDVAVDLQPAGDAVEVAELALDRAEHVQRRQLPRPRSPPRPSRSRPTLPSGLAPALAVRRAVPGDVGDVAHAHEPPVGQPDARRDHLRGRDLEPTLRQPLCNAFAHEDANANDPLAWRVAPAALETSAFAFASDLADEGVDAVLDNIQERGGLGGITPAFSYHAARDVFPHNPRRRCSCPTAAQLYFPPDRALYEGLRIQPRVDPLARERDVLAETCRAAAERGHARRRVDDLPARRPARRVSGLRHRATPSATATRPTSALRTPTSRAYARALVADVAPLRRRVDLAESLHYHGLEHGYHHERYFIELGTKAPLPARALLLRALPRARRAPPVSTAHACRRPCATSSSARSQPATRR